MIICTDEDNPKLPTKGGLARYLGISRETIYDWSSKYEEFSDIVEDLFAEQEDMLIQNGLTNKFNASITKVILTKHGYREGVDMTTNDKDLPTPIASVSRNDSISED